MQKKWLLILLSSLFYLQTWAQVSGVVTAADDKQPLPSVTIKVKGVNQGTVTDLDGKYKISVSENAVLIFSYVGYNDQEIPVNGKKFINVELIPKTVGIGEVVVVGYGTTKKADLSSSISTMDPKDAIKMPGGVQESMKGRIAGVQITGDKIRIRGVGSINGTDPLIVVDGLIGASLPNENDLESLQVLKDAASCAIYGSRGSNGVIIATTKKGKKGKLKIDYEGFGGIKNIDHQIKMLDASGLAMLINEAMYNDKPNRTDYPTYNANPKGLGKGSDLQNQMFKTGNYNNQNLSISGGSDDISFRIAGNYYDDNGIAANKNNSNGFSLLTNTIFTKGKLKIGETIKMGQNKSMGSGGIDIPSSLNWPSTLSPYIISGDPTSGLSNPGNGADTGNPLVGLNYGGSWDNDNIYIDGTIWAEYEIFKGLTYKFNTGFDFGRSEGTNYQKSYTYNAHVTPLSFSENTGSYQNRMYENTLTYVKKIDKHDFTVLLGYSTEQSTGKNISTSTDGLLRDYMPTLSLPSAKAIIGASESMGSNARESFLGRINYIYDNKYIITANFRRDGASVFSSENRFGNFPSISAAWKLNEEAFVKDNFPNISTLKLRGGYGSLGFSGIDGFSYNSYVTSGLAPYKLIQYSLGKDSTMVQGAIPSSPASKGLKWESSYSGDFGVDLGLFNDKITVTVDYYDRTTKDMLVKVPISFTNGYRLESAYQNAGSINNKGLEIAASYRNEIGKFNYKISGTISTVNNTVVSLGNGNSIPAGKISDYTTLTAVGHSIGEFYGFKTDGIYKNQAEIDAMNKPALDGNGNPVLDKNGKQIINVFASNAQPGDIRFADLNHDGKLDVNDRTFLGSPIPKFSYGLSIDLGYTSSIGVFDFSMQWNGNYGNKLWNNGKSYLEGMKANYNEAAVTANRFRATDLYWYYNQNTQTGTMYNPAIPADATAISGITNFYNDAVFYPQNLNGTLPRATMNDPNKNIALSSDYYVEDGSYLRLQYINIGYSLPKRALDKLNISNLRFYVGGKNLLTITKYSGYNPDFNSSTTWGTAPQLERGVDYMYSWTTTFTAPREFFAGAQLSF